ncbi:MAG: membrane dipeptidase [Cyclobacteriaceae bacterium]
MSNDSIVYPPVIDLHCDLLSYLESVPNSTPFDSEQIGVSIPNMKEGNVGLQIMAIYTATEKGSVQSALKQSLIFKDLLHKYEDDLTLVKEVDGLARIHDTSKIGILASIESASGLCEEDQPLDVTFRNLEEIISNTESILYISLTHHTENRFGGGNYSKAGLKDDGKALLDYIDGRKIAVDFSHTSDALAYGILDHLTKKNLDIPVLASHSNYREIFSHPRNLPNDIAKEIIRRKGLIGINFVRAFLNNDDPNAMYDHIDHGLKIGGGDAICFGADYFHTGSHPDPEREPFYFKGQESAVCYPSILKRLEGRTSSDFVHSVSNQNVMNYLRRIWS